MIVGNFVVGDGDVCYVVCMCEGGDIVMRCFLVY